MMGYSLLGFSIVVVVIILCWYIRYIRLANFFKRQQIPGPKPKLFALFSLKESFEERTCLHLSQINGIKNYGNIFGIFLGGIPCYIIADVDIVKQIMINDFCYFPNRPTISNDFLDDGLYNLQDHQWKRIRNMLAPSLCGLKIKQLTPLMNQSVRNHLSRLVNTNDATQPVDIIGWTNNITLEIIMTSIFGVTVDMQTDSDDKFVQCAISMFQMRSFVAILTFFCPCLARYWIKLDRTFYNSIQYVELMSKAVIQQRKKEVYDDKSPNDLLRLILNSVAANQKINLTDDEIVCQLMTFLMAAYKTISSTIALTAYILALHPDIQDKVIAEIENACLDQLDITYEMINQMDYLEMVLLEVLRLYPPDFLILRKTKYDVEINNKYRFGKGAMILIPVYGIHHHEEYWPEPEKFNPDRFLKEEKDKRQPFCYLPFGHGPRNCIGIKFAIIQVKLVLAHFLRQFKFIKCDQTEIPLQLQTTTILGPKNRIKLQLQPH